MNRTNRMLTFKYASYALLLILLYVLQTVPGLFVLFRVKPVWVVSAAIAIAMMEGEFTGGVYGALAGLLCDMGGFSLFGFKGFFVCICCVGAGLLTIYLMHNSAWSALLFVLVTLTLTMSLEYYFAYGIWGHDSGWKVYTFQVLPTILYSVLTAPIPYLIVRRMHRAFAAALRKL